MPNATRDTDTRWTPGLDLELNAAANQTFYKGTFVGVNAAGLAGNLSATFNKVAGVMYINHSDKNGVNGLAKPTFGGESIEVRRGYHRFKSDGSITQANLLQVARAIDDQTVGMAGGIAPAGIIERVDTDGYVIVSLEVARSSAVGNGVA